MFFDNITRENVLALKYCCNCVPTYTFVIFNMKSTVLKPMKYLNWDEVPTVMPTSCLLKCP